MVGVNLVIYGFGTVAIFATLFVAFKVNAEKGCIFDAQHLYNFDLECNGLKRTWTISDDVKDSPKREILLLEPEQDGCLKTKNAVILNSISPVVFRFRREGTKDEKEKITLRLVPKEGSCPDDECVWNIMSDPQYKSGEWISAIHKFPLKTMREYYVQLQVYKNKGKFFVDRIVLPNVHEDSNRCERTEGGVRAAYQAGMNEVNLPSPLIGVRRNTSESETPSLSEISKNFLLTSASILTLNTLLS